MRYGPPIGKYQIVALNIGPEDRAIAETTMESIWFCPSRWLLAHHDPQANISTTSSHICLADLNNDGENLLALVDFKQIQTALQTPYQCRLRVYRGKHLIFNHFLDDLPSCMVVTSNRAPIVTNQGPPGGGNSNKSVHRQQTSRLLDRHLLVLPINDDVYFYHQLKGSHRISLEDDERILETLNKSELDAWQMVKQNKVDVESMRELLSSLSDAHGSQELTSHSNNFLALTCSEERNNYLLLWKFKKLSNGFGEHIMSMDTICCAAARLRYDMSSSRLSDNIGSGSSIRWNKLIDIQKDGLVLGTEDRHLLIYELGYSRAHLEANYRLPSTADHILVECRSPLSFNPKSNLEELTYKIVVSCRNCRIYTIDQSYLPDRGHSSKVAAINEIIALSSNVIDMCWTAEDDVTTNWPSSSSSDYCSNFIVACLDRRVYCFSSKTGQNKWIAELDSPITCLVSLPMARMSQSETCLVGVASQTNRIDFYISSSGRIVDSIYLADDYCQAMTFGRFGREENCLCVVTSKGSLIILILKRTAKFANAQCLSSAASYAAHVVTSSCAQSNLQDTKIELQQTGVTSAGEAIQKMTMIKEPPELPKPFAITKSNIVNPTDRALDQIQLNHNCEQVVAKEALDSHLVNPKLKIPTKNRDFVDQIVHQARHATTVSKSFARDILRLRDKVRLASQKYGELISHDSANRISLIDVTGLGNVYRVSLSLRLEIDNRSVGRPAGEPSSSAEASERMVTQVILFLANRQQRCHLKPSKFDLDISNFPSRESEGQRSQKFISESTLIFKLVTMGQDVAPNTDQDEEPITVDVHVMPPRPRRLSNTIGLKRSAIHPAIVSSINVPSCH